MSLLGEAKVRAALLRVQAEIAAAEGPAAAAGAKAVLDKAAAAAPRLTGELASSGHVEPGFRGARVTFRSGHARFVEQGTRNMAAEPFLGPAADSSRAAILARMAAVLRRAIR